MVLQQQTGVLLCAAGLETAPSNCVCISWARVKTRAACCKALLSLRRVAVKSLQQSSLLQSAVVVQSGSQVSAAGSLLVLQCIQTGLPVSVHAH